MDPSGRHVVITGASRGVGAALADEFAAKGARVTLVARSVDALAAVAERTGGNALSVVAAGQLCHEPFIVGCRRV